MTPLPTLADAAAPADVLGRIALEAFADPTMRLPPRPSDPAAASWLEALRRQGPALRDRVDRVAELAGVERRRWRYFAGQEAPRGA